MEATLKRTDDATHIVLLSRETVQSMRFRILQAERSARPDVARILRSHANYLRGCLIADPGENIELRHRRDQLEAICVAAGDVRIGMEVASQLGAAE